MIRDVVLEWNQRRGKDTGCIFSVLTWEDSVTSELEDYGQGSINSQIGDSYDVILGIMWSRFGSPTGKEDSGTLEEFKRALKRKREGDPVRISFYFKSTDVPMAKLDPDQYKKVQEFKLMFQTEGGLSRDFASDDQLRTQVNLLLDQISRDKEKYAGTAPGRRDGGTLPDTATERAGQSEPTATAEEIGLLDTFERMEITAARFAEEMDQWTRFTEELGAVAISATDELTSLARFGNPPPLEVRAVIDKVTAQYNATSEYVETKSPSVTSLMSEMVTLIEAWVGFHPEFEVTREVKSEQLKQLTQLEEGMALTLENSRGLVKTIGELPRMTTKFALAQKRLIKAYEPFLSELEQSLTAVHRAIESINGLSPATRMIGEENAASQVSVPTPKGRAGPRKKKNRPKRRRK